MNESKKPQSPLVKAVLTLDEHFAELERVGTKINTMELKSEFDLEHAQKLLMRFAECGHGVSEEVTNLGQLLNEARSRAETIASGVAERAAQLQSRKVDEQAKLAEFNELGTKVRELSAGLASLRRGEGEQLTPEDRAKISLSLSQFESQLAPLIEHAQRLRREAHEAKMKSLEQNADSLTQTLQSIQTKLNGLHLPHLVQ